MVRIRSFTVYTVDEHVQLPSTLALVHPGGKAEDTIGHDALVARIVFQVVPCTARLRLFGTVARFDRAVFPLIMCLKHQPGRAKRIISVQHGLHRSSRPNKRRSLIPSMSATLLA